MVSKQSKCKTHQISPYVALQGAATWRINSMIVIPLLIYVESLIMIARTVFT